MPPRKGHSHKATAEKSIVMPGGGLQTVFQVSSSSNEEPREQKNPKGKRRGTVSSEKPMTIVAEDMEDQDDWQAQERLEGSSHDKGKMVAHASEDPVMSVDIMAEVNSPDSHPIRWTSPRKKMVTWKLRQQDDEDVNEEASVILFTPRRSRTAKIQPLQFSLEETSPLPGPAHPKKVAFRKVLLDSEDSEEDEDSVLEDAMEQLVLREDRRSGSEASPSPQDRSQKQSQGQIKLRVKGAKDVWTFYEFESGKQVCLFCRQAHAEDEELTVAAFSKKTATGPLRRHLYENHLGNWVTNCDQMGIKISAKDSEDVIEEYRRISGQRGQSPRTPYSKSAFEMALVEFIVGDDLSINIIESPRLHAIFLMLHSELRESDIPGRTTIHNRIKTAFNSHLGQMQAEMKNTLGKISYTTDIWSDPNLTPFMAVTAHWIEEYAEEASGAKQLRLRADLIGFHRIPGHHTGEHLAHCFLFITDRVNTTKNMGWITSDNARNNDTMMAVLERELRHRKIKFDRYEQRIRCFPHVVNLACKAILMAITNLDYAEEDAEEYVPGRAPPSGILHLLDKDPIATLRSLIGAIRSSSIRRQCFADTLKTLEEDNLQLLRDVVIRWSSTLLMIERGLKLKNGIEAFLDDPEFSELLKFKLNEADWAALQTFQEILEIPHAFQQLLSHEKIPTLCNVLPAFEALKQKWTEYMGDNEESSSIIEQGLEKLGDYSDRIDFVPAYVLAMAIDPQQRLDWFQENAPQKFSWARSVLIKAIRSHPANIAITEVPQAATTSNKRVPTSNAANILGLGQRRNRGQNDSVETEVDRFLNETETELEGLLFWQTYRQKYPRIFPVAMDILPIPASSVPCERVFSSGKETMTLRRNRMSAELMEALQLLKFSIRQGKRLNFTQGLDWNEEIQELEFEADLQTQCPEDVKSYSRSLADSTSL